MQPVWFCFALFTLATLHPLEGFGQVQRSLEEQRAYLDRLWSRFTPRERNTLAADLKERQRAIERQTAILARETAQIDQKLNRLVTAGKASTSSNFNLLQLRGQKQSELGELGKSLQAIQASFLTINHLTTASIKERESIADRALLQLQTESISAAAHPSYLMCADDILDKARLSYWESDVSNFAKQHISVGESVGKVGCSRRLDAATETCTQTSAEPANWAFFAVGTAFVVRSDLMVTNRHVVEIFAKQDDGMRWAMRPGYVARVEFPSLYGGCVGTRPMVMKMVTEIFVHPSEDIAVLKFKDGGLPATLVLQPTAQYSGPVGVIGYPERDFKVPRALQESVFKGPKGDVPFGVRRMQPGEVTLQEKPQQWRTDASALNGNSGSPVVQLRDARVVGIHVGGYPGGENVFIGAAEINRLLQSVP